MTVTATAHNGHPQGIPLHASTLDYFPPTSTLPTPPHPTSPSIIATLLLTAGVDHTRYPPRTYTELQALVAAVQQSSFDVLRRNALLYYLLLDYHLLPSSDRAEGTSLTLSSLPTRSPFIDQFAVDHLLPAFWTDAVERGFWRFDKGLHQEALPWLNATNSVPYADHILKTLSPLKTRGSVSDVLHNARCLIKYYRIAKPLLPETGADRDVVEAVVVAKAMVEGLQGALTLIRDRQPEEQDGLFATLWHWLFHLQVNSSPRNIVQMRSSLLRSVIALPLAEGEVQTLVTFSHGKTVRGSHTLGDRSTPSTSLLQARHLALDTLLVRLINSGRVLDALKVNKLAEDSQSSSIGIEEDVSEADSSRRKKRREMLRLAREMLPEVVRSQLEAMSVSNDVGKSAEVPREDEMEEVVSSHISAGNDLSASAAVGLTTATSSYSGAGPSPGIPGYLHNHTADSTPISRSRQSVGAATPPPSLLQRSTPTQQRPHIPLVSQSPLSLAATRASPALTSFARASPSATRFNPSPVAASGRNGARGTDGEDEEGPYARLAAQLTSSVNGYTGAEMAVEDQSVLLASLLPQKRSLATRRQEGDDSDMLALTGNREASADRLEGGGSARGGFEVPKRRYTKKDQDSTNSSAATGAHAGFKSKGDHATASPARPKGSAARSKAGEPLKRGASGLRKSTTMGNLANSTAADDTLQSLRTGSITEAAAVAGGGGGVDGGGRKKTAGAGERKRSANPTAGTISASTRRSTRAQSESVPGSFPGAEGGEADESAEEDERNHMVEGGEEKQKKGRKGTDSGEIDMVELSSTPRSGLRGVKSQGKTSRKDGERSASPVKRSNAAAVASGATNSGTLRRSGRAKTPSGGQSTNSNTAAHANGNGSGPSESTPVRRSTRMRTPAATPAATSPPPRHRTGAAHQRGTSSRGSSVVSSRYADDDDEGEGEEGLRAGEDEENDEGAGRRRRAPHARSGVGRTTNTRSRSTRSMSVISSSTTSGQDEQGQSGADGEEEDQEGDADQTTTTLIAKRGGTRGVRRSARR